MEPKEITRVKAFNQNIPMIDVDGEHIRLLSFGDKFAVKDGDDNLYRIYEVECAGLISSKNQTYKLKPTENGRRES